MGAIHHYLNKFNDFDEKFGYGGVLRPIFGDFPLYFED